MTTKYTQWAVMPNEWRNGMQSIPYVLTGMRNLDGLVVAQGIAAILRKRGIACCTQLVTS